MSDSQQYILRKPYDLPNGDKWIDVSWDDFDELFQPLDIPAIEKQLRDELNEYIYMMVWESVQHSLEEKEWAEGMREHSKKVIVNIVLDSLFGLEEERKDD